MPSTAIAVVEPADQLARVPAGGDRYGRRPDEVTRRQVRRPSSLNDIPTDDLNEQALRSSADETHRAEFKVLLREMFDDAGVVIPRVNVDAAPSRGAGPERRGDFPIHAVTLVQPDGDIVTRIDEDSLTSHLDEIREHIADVRHFVAGYQGAFRKRVLWLQFAAVSFIVGVPQLWSGAVGQVEGSKLRLLAPLAALVVGFGEIGVDGLLRRRWDHPLYRWFRGWRDAKWHGWAISALSAATAMIAVGGNPLDDFDIGDYEVLLWILLTVLAIALIALVAGSWWLRRLRSRYLG